MDDKYAVVIIGYNRLDSIRRLCNSLECADYLGDSVDLIISLDFWEDKSVYNFAKDFQWKYGNKKVIYHQEKMGLRKHILSCGSFLDDYEALAILEDDIYVAPGFYSYMKQAVKYYEANDNIAGISLYSFGRNWYDELGFKPEKSEYDTFFMQMAQSWGQIWMKKQWKEFYNWYLANQDGEFFEHIHIPKAIKKWKESWLKFHTSYCVIKHKFFVYPYEALSTCFLETGVHTKYQDNTGQVSLCMYSHKKYHFAEFGEDAVKYDVFYERMNLEKHVAGLPENVRLCVNLYGDKYVFDGMTHLITTNTYTEWKPLRSYALRLKPQELNIMRNIEGNDIHLYDIRNRNLNTLSVKSGKWRRLEYFSSPKLTTDFRMMLMYFRKLINKYIL